MDNFSTEKTYCFLCGDIESCNVCPVYVAYSTSSLGKIPGWVCKINKIKMRMKKIFTENFKKIKKIPKTIEILFFFVYNILL
jgi:hypothetical protein